MSAISKGCIVAAAATACIAGGSGRADNVAVCTSTPVLRSDGTVGRYNEVTTKQWKEDAPFKGSPAANYADGKGLSCDELPGFVFTGYDVGSDGKVTGGKGDVYPFFVKAGQ